jgi:hypothetical protein
VRPRFVLWQTARRVKMMGAVIIVVVVLALVAMAAAFLWRTQYEVRVAIGEWFEDFKDRVLFPPVRLPPRRLQKRIEKSVLASVVVSAGGRGVLESAVIHLAPEDLGAMRSSRTIVQCELVDHCRKEAREKGYSVQNEFSLVLLADPEVPEGRPLVVPGESPSPAGDSSAPDLRLVGSSRADTGLGEAVGVTPSTTMHETSASSRHLTDEVVGTESPSNLNDGIATVPRRQETWVDFTPFAMSGAAGPGLRGPNPMRLGRDGGPLGRSAVEVETMPYAHTELIPLDWPWKPAVGYDLSEVSQRTLRVGRDLGCEIYVANSLVSGHHADLVHVCAEWHLIDRGSTNGTFLNGERVQRTVLNHNDVVTLGLNGPRFFFSRLAKPLDGRR